MSRYAVARKRAVPGISAVGPARKASGGRKKRTPPGAGASQPHGKGVQISLGPLDGDRLRYWVTFPVTPESIPVQTAAAWSSKQYLVGGEAIGFAGKQLDVVSFSGRLEPPEYYISGNSPLLDDTRARDINADRLENAQNQARISGPRFDLGDSQQVVMMDGARAGQNFLEADGFKELLEDIEKDGEVVRLVIGDDFGWNHAAVITDFSWRFEDPDPDTLLYDISFKQHRETRVKSALKQREQPKDSSYTTKVGDTLQSVAIYEWNVSEKWREILKNNRALIGNLWWYPDVAGSGGAAQWRNKGSIGHKIAGRSDGFQISSKSSSKGDLIPADLPFRGGVTLRIYQDFVVGDPINTVSPKKHHSKGR